MHRNISRAPWIFGEVPPGRTRGITGLVYSSIRTVTGWVGSGLDLALAQLQPLIDAAGLQDGGLGRDALVGAINGVLGDYLAATGNPLATDMEIRRDGIRLDQAQKPRVLLLIHGLCMTDRQWRRDGHDHGAALAEALGYEAAYLRYNSGRHVSLNGRELSELLERFIEQSAVPVEELAIIGFSMGGLLARSACHYAALAGHRWPRRLRRLIFLGTPHLGAPLERGGSGLQMLLNISPYSAPLAGLGKLRSAGITDLRHGNLIDEDWADTDRFDRSTRRPQALPLPANVHCAALAATTGQRAGDLNDRLLGDGLVPVASALGDDADSARSLSFDPEWQWIGFGMNHLDLLNRSEAFDALQRALQAPLG
ncbi:MAG: hypothetical protein JWQ90_877 [Hydrocarboniphaga sp.]|nr:hypothetical protein [Hydrocarboniphaga sp.]